MMPHETLKKFGYPEGLIFETMYWATLLRPAQVTLGSMVVIFKGQATRLCDTTPEAFSEFPVVCERLEEIVKIAFGAQKFNYLALMMVDPHVHFHCIPRYQTSVAFGNSYYEDPYWPKPVDITHTIPMEKNIWAKLLNDMQLIEKNNR